MSKKQKTGLYVTLFLLAFALLIMLPGIRSAFADRIYGGDNGVSEVDMQTTELKVSLLENGQAIGDGGVYSSLKNKKIDPGYTYSDSISAKNDGTMTEVVRVIVKKYWTDKEGKRIDLDPALIHLSYKGNAYNDTDWKLNDAEHTPEQDVYYLSSALSAGGEKVLFDGIGIDSSVGGMYTLVPLNQEETELEAVYEYDSITFVVVYEIQSVQLLGGTQAVVSAWGVTNVTVSDDGTVTVGE